MESNTLQGQRAGNQRPSGSASQPLLYRRDIDGLRALAVGSVLLFHCGVPGFGGGYVGVDIFFVISGYLITGHLAAEIAADKLSILRFYERRVRRIAPALFVTLMVTWGIGLAIFLPSYLVRTSSTMIAAAASVSNILLWQTANYFAPDAATQPLLHTWSLSVEEQFYAIIPVLMLLVARLGRPRWVALFSLLCLTSFALSLYATRTAPTGNFYLLPTRAWELGIGSLLATSRLPAVRGRLAAELLGVVGLALLMVPVFAFDDATAFPGMNALYPCLGAVALIHAGRSPRCFATALLGTRPLVWIGLISYSLYLVHWPIIVFLRYQSLAPLTALQMAFVVVFSPVVAFVSWRFVEQPFRRATPVLTQRRVLAGGATAILIACLVGVVGLRSGGFPGRFPGFAERVIPGQEQWKEGRCFLTGNPDWRSWSLEDCTRVATGPRRVLLWGDSFAAHYVPGVLANAVALGATIIQYTAAGCPPVLSYESYARVRCAEFNRHALDIVREQKIDTVIVSGRWTDMQHRGLGEITSTLSALKALGVSVVLMGQSPEFSQDVQVIAFLKGNAAASANNRWPVFFNDGINRQIAGLAGSARFVNPMPPTCDALLCTYQDHGTFYFADYGHYSAAGSAIAVRADWFVGNKSIFAGH